MSTSIDWQAELVSAGAIGLLAALRRRDPGLPAWPEAERTFADFNAQGQQDRILRALVVAYQGADMRAGPIIVALLWRRICARCCGDLDQIQSTTVGLLEVCQRYQHTDREGLPMRLIAAAADRIRARGPAIRTTQLSDLIPSPRPSEQPTDDLLTPAEAAKALGLSTQTLIRWGDSGRIKPIRLPSGHRRYATSEVERIRRGGAARQQAGQDEGSGDGSGQDGMQ